MIDYYRAAVRLGSKQEIRPISAPTLVIWGQGDRYLGRKLAEPHHEDVPNLDRVERLPNASHWVHHDEAERVNELLVDFLAVGSGSQTAERSADETAAGTGNLGRRRRNRRRPRCEDDPASMRAVIYANTGDASVLQVVERPLEEPAEGEVRIRVVVSGVNPTDWKSRSGAFGGAPGEPTVPNHDGAGIVDAVGSGVDGIQAGDRVWVTLAADGRPASGTAQEYTVVPAERVFPLPDGADFELGASIGIPA